MLPQGAAPFLDLDAAAALAGRARRRAQCDAEGMIWVALNGAGRVVRIDPATGSIDLVVHTPGCPTPTSCTFGGPDLDELFITTAARPAGGQLFRAKMPFGIKGLPEPEWQGGD